VPLARRGQHVCGPIVAFPLNAIATGTTIVMQDGTQINQIGANAWQHVQIALAVQIGGSMCLMHPRLCPDTLGGGDLGRLGAVCLAPCRRPSEDRPANSYIRMAIIQIY
jgi:hypothetical protein